MVDVMIADGKLHLEVKGMDKLWAFKSRLEIPLEDVVGAHADPALKHGLWQGIRMPGTHIPGLFTAGTYYHDGRKIFWDVKAVEDAIVIDLQHDNYDQLIVEVENPAEVIAAINAAVGERDHTPSSAS